MNSVPADLLSAIVTLLAIALYFYMGVNVGQMRHKHGVKAPTMTGPLAFECAVRVQANTLEHLPVFITLLWLATVYFHFGQWLPPAFGLLWVVGRVFFMTGYMADPEKRGTGFVISSIAEVMLFLMAVVGVIANWPGLTA